MHQAILVVALVSHGVIKTRDSVSMIGNGKVAIFARRLRTGQALEVDSKRLRIPGQDSGVAQ